MSDLRSRLWFGPHDLNGMLHRGWLRAQGLPADVFDGRPIIGIASSWSEATPCNAHLRRLAEHVKRGVWEAGGVPLEFPAMSLSENLIKPTAMLFRNLLSMELEEMIRGMPFDAVVLLSGCDKTTAGMLLGAASADVPCLMVTGGPMLRGIYGTRELPGATAVWEISAEQRAGWVDDATMAELEGCVARSDGHCGVMGTASTMAAMAESLGLTLPGNAAIPAVDARRFALAHQSGRLAVGLAHSGIRPHDILRREAFDNAITVGMAVGGSTNAIVHLLALAGRVGVKLGLDDFDRISRRTPLIADVQPSGRYQMEDFFYAGGIPAVMNSLLPLLNQDAPTVSGRTIGEQAAAASVLDGRVIRTLGEPLSAEGGTIVLRGNLAPDGAVLKRSAASPGLLRHRGRAVVFTDKLDLMQRIDDPGLRVDASSVLVQQMGGPRGGPGMPEWGMLPIPARLVRQGVSDMVRISDARMSGTAYGTCVLHVAPESAIGGPLALVRDGDEIELDADARRLSLLVDDEELGRRRAEWSAREPAFERGYGRLYLDHVQQASEGADFDFLVGGPETDPAPYRPTSH